MNDPTRRSKRAPILVVEDNADQWTLIQWALQERFPEVEAIWAQGATQAMSQLDACEKNARTLPKLILLDLYLPQRHQGWQLLETIKTHYLYRDIPVIILSQSSDKEDITESYSLRVNSYIVKPPDHQTWLTCIASFRHYWWESVTLPRYR